MEVLDIVRSAAFKAGVVPSFNPDELPEDVLNAGGAALVDEIVPTLNCDRTIDITETSRLFKPVNGRIVLKPFSQPRQNFSIEGYIKWTLADLYIDSVDSHVLTGRSRFFERIHELHPEWVTYNTITEEYEPNMDNWPHDDMNNPTDVALWTSDIALVHTYQPISGSLRLKQVEGVNIDFPPMRVDAVMDENSRYTYDYLYRDEYERTFKFTSLPGIYTTEEYDDKLIILLNGSPDVKLVVLPVPLQIVNRDYAHSGTIIAPEKFRRYLIDAVAVSLAIIYGMSTLPLMKEAAATSYNLLKKNKPQPLHKANVAQEITNKLRPDVLGRRFYANI